MFPFRIVDTSNFYLKELFQIFGHVHGKNPNKVSLSSSGEMVPEIVFCFKIHFFIKPHQFPLDSCEETRQSETNCSGPTVILGKQLFLDCDESVLKIRTVTNDGIFGQIGNTLLNMKASWQVHFSLC